MKKTWLIIIAAFVLLGGIAGLAIFAGKQSAKEKTSNDKSKMSEQDMHAMGNHAGAGHLGKKQACDYFSQADAEDVLGTAAQKSELNITLPLEDENLQATTCYYAAEGAPVSRSVGLTLTAPLTNKGAAANIKAYDDVPDTAPRVDGYGDKAYWDEQTGQLAVLKDGATLLIRSSDKTLDGAKQVADIVLAAYNKH